MSAGRALASSALLWLTSACTVFPNIPSGTCGNGVLEPPEDCDRLAPSPGLVCRPKGAADECHLDCTPRAGERGKCPSGWGCDASFVCREPSGEFADPSSTFDIGAWSLASGNFDGDGRDDVMSSEPLDSIGATRVNFLYFDSQGDVAETRPFPKLMISPTITKLSGDEFNGVVFTDGPLGVMRGRPDRSWVPDTFTSYRAAGVTVRVIAVFDQRVEGATPFLPFFSYAGGPDFPGGSGFFAIDAGTGKLEERAHVPAFISDLVGEPVSGNVFEDKQTSPCFEPVYALRGASHFTVVNTCQTDPEQGVRWRETFEQTDIALEPPAAIDAAPQFVDLDDDGHLDVLVGALGKPYVAYGDGQSLAVAVPYRLSLANTSEISPDIPMPLAVADFTGDGAPDFVFPDHLLVSAKSGSSSLPVYTDGLRNRLGSPATSAKIADFNGNGKLDVVTASSNSLNIEFYNGLGGPGLTENLITTSAPVQALAAGDFDGDGINDLALLEVPRVDELENAIQIAYGKAFSPLGVPAFVAQVNQAAQFCAVAENAISSLVIASSDEIDGQASGALTILDASSDRVPFASFALTEFVSNGTVQDSIGIAVASGAFTRPGQGDLVALAVDPPTSRAGGSPALNFWVAPAIEAPGAFPRRLLPALDPRLTPTAFFDMNADFTVDVASASADLDGDGRDEAIFVMPAGADRRQCGLVTLNVAEQLKDFVLRAREPVLLDEPCADPSVVSVDADADGALDLAVLTGEATSTDRKLYVLWNDGHGGFSSTNLALISGSSDSPQAFSVLPAREQGLPTFAYVTPNLLRLVRSPSGRQFAEPETLLDKLAGGTGITTADVNGDRVSDLVIAESGKLRVLKAKLKLP